jgi:hypothetical protein
MEVFKIIPPNFFGLLTGKNKELYVKALFVLFKAYEQGSILGMDKAVAHSVLSEFLEDQPYEIEDEDADDPTSTAKDKATQILRRLEDAEWIDVDVTNDYVEILNFRDYAITVIEALKAISQDSFYGYDDEAHEFRGYIFTVYTLLQAGHIEYGMVLDQVYKNTIAFVREIRKLDSRLKYYIRSIIEHSEIKDLITLLVNYKVELVDQAYHRLKTSDNIAKYQLEIVKKLELFQQNALVMDAIAREYLPSCGGNLELAKARANKKVDDMIDIYNSLPHIIDEIDKKNKIYINSTIAKIKFLLNDDENIIGKLSSILKFMAKQIKRYKTDKALSTVQPIFTLRTHRSITNDSLYVPRGAYSHSEAQFLNEADVTQSAALQEAFYKEFETFYSEDVIRKYLGEFFLIKPKVLASELISKDMSDEAILRLLYSLAYAGEDMGYFVSALDQSIDHPRFQLTDFQINRGYHHDSRKL